MGLLEILFSIAICGLLCAFTMYKNIQITNNATIKSIFDQIQEKMPQYELLLISDPFPNVYNATPIEIILNRELNKMDVESIAIAIRHMWPKKFQFKITKEISHDRDYPEPGILLVCSIKTSKIAPDRGLVFHIGKQNTIVAEIRAKILELYKYPNLIRLAKSLRALGFSSHAATRMALGSQYSQIPYDDLFLSDDLHKIAAIADERIEKSKVIE